MTQGKTGQQPKMQQSDVQQSNTRQADAQQSNVRQSKAQRFGMQQLESRQPNAQQADTQREFFARCAGGFEHVLGTELKGLGAQRVRPLKGGVSFFGTLSKAYRACLWCYSATRIQLVLARIDAQDAEALYNSVRAFTWEEHIAPDSSIAIAAFGTNKELRNTQFTALKVKDAVCDRLRDVCGQRPSVDVASPDISIDVSIHERRATLYLNLSGESLHKRGYRQAGKQAVAPLKETLAAGMLLAAGWPDMVAATVCENGMRSSASQESQTSQAGEYGNAGTATLGFVDSFCGSGTLAIEAALMALRIAPGLSRQHWGFEKWRGHRPELWQRLRQEAEAARISPADCRLTIAAGDIDERAVQLAQENALRAGVQDLIHFYTGDAAQTANNLERLNVPLPARGLLATNPPYGKRLEAAEGQAALQTTIESVAISIPSGWKLACISPDDQLDVSIGTTPETILLCHNGPLEVAVRVYSLQERPKHQLQLVSLGGLERTIDVAHKQSEQFAARLRKVAKERMKWARREGVYCYRIYDADLPDYASSIDYYTDQETHKAYVRINEYQAPASVDPLLAAQRFKDTCALAAAVLDVDPSCVYAKVRRRAKGGSQYREAQAEAKMLQVEEGPYTFEVDLNSYMDTGLFLDHRLTRQMVGALAQGARFLNLFAYTGTASVYAAGGGANATTTVDLSRTYLNWAKRNMATNGFTGEEHRFIQADVLQWLEQAPKQGMAAAFDLVFCDPPTFSNSKSMEAASFDIQRDHVALLAAIVPLLAPHATVVFSCNLRNFKLDTPAVEALGFRVDNITAETIPHDFARNPKIHHCYKLSY